MARYFLEVSYDGSLYGGFQIQANHQTIQGEIEKALETQVPHEVLDILLAKEILIEIMRKIIHNIHKVFFLASCLFLSVEAGK